MLGLSEGAALPPPTELRAGPTEELREIVTAHATRLFDAPDWRDQLDQHAKGRFWPITRTIDVRGPLSMLKSGVVISDLPGTGDLNRARASQSAAAIKEAGQILIACDNRGLQLGLMDVLEGTARLPHPLFTVNESLEIIIVGTSLDKSLPDIEEDARQVRDLGLDPSLSSPQDVFAAVSERWREHVLGQFRRWLRDRVDVFLPDLSAQDRETRVELILSRVSAVPTGAKDWVRHCKGKKLRYARTASDTGLPALRERINHLAERQIESTVSNLAQRIDGLRAEVLAAIEPSELWERTIAEATTEIGKLLREQQPVGGQAGTVNRTMVRQFRMPAYPLVLVTTDLLQEGEDLHLFCSRVYHYGISWMPSSLEQRIGRIDRVRSHTERRLTSIESQPVGEHLLQVFYPYLPETVEVFQVDRVFDRLDRFIRLMHERFGGADDDGDKKVDVRFEAGRGRRRSVASTTPLKSAFPVKREMTAGPDRELAVDPRSEEEALERFKRLAELDKVMPIEWRHGMSKNALVGTLNGARRQPFTLVLHSVKGALNVRCISPVGQVDPRADTERIAREARGLRARLGAVYDPRFKQYQLTVEGDILLGRRASDLVRARWLVETVAAAADRMEEILLEVDLDPAPFHADLAKEADFER